MKTIGYVDAENKNREVTEETSKETSQQKNKRNYIYVETSYGKYAVFDDNVIPAWEFDQFGHLIVFTNVGSVIFNNWRVMIEGEIASQVKLLESVNED